MSAKIIVYSKYPISAKFFNPNTNREFILKGMNSHPLIYDEKRGHHVSEHNEFRDPRSPISNEIFEEDWEWLKATYGKNPNFFCKFNGDVWFTAKDRAEAKLKMDNMSPVVQDVDIVSTKHKKVSGNK